MERCLKFTSTLNNITLLDFYLLKDEQPKPDYPEKAGLKFVGGLDEIVFDSLKRTKR